MNFKYSVNTTRNSTAKNIVIKLKEESKHNNDVYIKDTNENNSPNFDGKAATPKSYGMIKNLLNSTKNSDKKIKSINFEIKKKVINVFNQQKEENFQKANTDKVKISHRSFGIIHSYAAITTEGYVR
jgi:hypothetical protein